MNCFKIGRLWERTLFDKEMFNLVFVLQFCIAGFIIKLTIGRKMFSTEDKILRFVCTVALYSNPVYRHIKTYLYQLV